MTHTVIGTVRIVLAAAALMTAPLLALGQSAPPSVEEIKRLEAKKSQLSADEKRIEAEKSKTAGEIDRINKLLVATGQRIQQSEAELSKIEGKLAELEVDETKLRGTLEERHGTISALLAALQRMGRNPPPVMITRREDALTMVRSAMLLSSAFPELRWQAVGLAKELKSLAAVIKTGRVEREKLAAEKTRHDEARIKLAALQDDKRRTSAQQQAELDGVRQEVARIAKSVEEMSDLLQRLDKGMAVTAAKTGGPAMAELAPSGGKKVAMADPRIRSSLPFEQARGTLQLPAQGRRHLSFGQKTPHGTISKGLGIQTRLGGTVFAPCDGLIVYAGEFRTYGQLLIISPGGGYHVLLAGLSQIDVQVGQSVLMGEPVGAMAAKSPAGQDPVLTVEFRKDQRPIDPDPWWSDASRKVQG